MIPPLLSYASPQALGVDDDALAAYERAHAAPAPPTPLMPPAAPMQVPVAEPPPVHPALDPELRKYLSAPGAAPNPTAKRVAFDWSDSSL